MSFPGSRLLLAALATSLVAAACGAQQPAAQFTVSVAPDQDPVAVRAVIPGQSTNFLVAITGTAEGDGAATVTAKASKATVEAIAPSSIKAGQVAEVWLKIDPTITEETTASVDITVLRAGVTRTVTRTMSVMPMSSEGRERDAQPHFDYWIDWLSANHPQLDINASTAWQPKFVSTLLVVSHMSYYSASWEHGLSWHAATIPPNDWSQIYLRRRTSELAPSQAFKLDSFSNRTAPYQISAPDVVVR